jgi:hypothetical protein
MLIGMKSALARAAGGTLVLIGLVGLALLPVLATQTIPERGRSRHILTAIVSVLLVAVGGLVLLGAGIICPIRNLNYSLYMPYRPLGAVNGRLEIANRLRCAQALERESAVSRLPRRIRQLDPAVCFTLRGNAAGS